MIGTTCLLSLGRSWWRVLVAVALACGALAPGANADLVGTFVEAKTFDSDPAWPGGLVVFDIFAEFDDPLDECFTVGGYALPEPPLVLTATDPAGFFNAAGLGDPNLPPDDFELIIFPARRWDTFVTIGITSYTGTNPVALSPMFPLIEGTSVMTDNGGWFLSVPNGGLGRAGNYPGLRVLIARLTVRTGYIVGLEGTLSYFDGGGSAVNVFINVAADEPFGACCLATGGSCVEDSQGDCLAAGGTFQGSLTECATTRCEGACCLTNGDCLDDQTFGECTGAGGIYQDLDTTCAGVPCPQPGACCFSDGSCSVLVEAGGADCIAAGGLYQGDDTTCMPFTCYGACCLTDGFCDEAQPVGLCIMAGGDWKGLFTTCKEVICPQPGACCGTDGNCTLAAETGGADCTAAGGTYQGDDTTCAMVSCPRGACCIDNGTCSDNETLETCTFKLSGIYFGAGTDCMTVSCAGACCFDDGTCSDEALEADCMLLGGAWQGAVTNCASTICPGGACCLPDDSCTAGTEADCLTAGGIYRGDESDCMSVECPAPGLVTSSGKISNTSGGLVGPLANLALFGASVASLGDLDEDGNDDIAVGAPTFVFTEFGAVWVLFLNADGTVKSEVRISQGEGGFVGPLDPDDSFGVAVAALGDVDGDGVPDMAVGASNDSVLGNDRGAIWMLFMNANGTVKAEQKIGPITGGFGDALEDGDFFGSSVTALDDLDADGVVDIAVGAFGDDGELPAPGCSAAGAVWILFLNSDGTVKWEIEIDSLPGETFCEGQFGRSVTGIDDLDGDGVGDLLVGEPAASDGDFDPGVVYVLFMNSDGTVKSHQKISTVEGNFDGALEDNDRFGVSCAWLRDLDGDGVSDVAVGAMFDDDGAPDQGAVWILFLNADGTVKDYQKISAFEGGFSGDLDAGDRFGFAVGSVGDLDGDGVRELIVGATGDDDAPPGPGMDFGATWVLFPEGLAGGIGFDDPQEFLAEGEPIIHAAGDLDGDGDDDVIVVIPDIDPGMPGNVQVYINLGEGVGGEWLGFREDMVLDPIIIEVGLDPTDVAIGQVDGLGGLDAIVTNAGDGTLSILINSGTPAVFDPPVPFFIGEIPRTIELDDFTPGAAPGPGGAQDAAVGEETSMGGGELVILVNDGAGGFTEAETAMLSGPPKSMEPEDLDDDKNTDLVIGGRNDPSVDIWLQGTTGPGGVITLPVGSIPADVATADFDADGFVDIASANTGGTVSIIMSTGGGTFAPAFDVVVGSDPRSITAADFDVDLDFDPDIAVAADDPDIGPSVQVLENVTDEEGVDFGPPIAYDFNGDPNHVIDVDLNGDGAIDLVTVNADEGATGGSVTARINMPPAPECPGDIGGDGEVGFQDLLSILAAWSPGGGSCIGCPEDIDGDGDVDFQDLLILLGAWGGCP